MFIIPHIPTIIYIILDNIESPKIKATKLKLKKPINPHTIAPIIEKWGE